MDVREGTGESKAVYVRRMFADIARRYDLLNAVLSFGFDSGWRKFAMAQVEGIPHEGAWPASAASSDELSACCLMFRDLS